MGRGEYRGKSTDIVGFGPISWNDDGSTINISVNGFDSNYGTTVNQSLAIVAPGDTATFTYFDPQTGLPTTATGTIPFPDTITATAAAYGPQHPTVQEGESFSGVVTAIGSGVQGATVSCGNCTAAPTTTAGGGAYILPYVQPGPVANTQTFTIGTPGANQTQVTASVNVKVFPVVTSVSPAIGPASGNVPVTLNGAGFDTATTNDVVNFNAPFPVFHGGHAQVVPQSVASNNLSAQLLTPRSPLSGDGTGYANVSATVNQLESNTSEYLYIVPGQPWLEVAPFLCGGGDATPNVYDAFGNPVSVPMTLSASYAAFRQANGALTARLVVSSGQTVSFVAFGPLTATNNQTSQSVTVAINAPTISPCTVGNLLWPRIQGVFLNPGNLTSNIGPNCLACGEGLTKTGIWTVGNPVTSVANVSIAGSSSRVIINNFEVRAVGGEQFQSYVNSSTLVAVQNAGIMASARTSSRLHEITFVGPALSIGLRHYRCHKSKQKNEVFRVTFRLPHYATAGAEHFHVLHLVEVNGGPGWVETQPTQITGQGNSVTATTKEIGVYALAQR
jgi:hypothetical protein